MVTELDEAINEEKINEPKEEKETKNEIISDKLKDPSLNIIPGEKKKKDPIYTDNFDDDIKKIKIVPKNKTKLRFFDDAESD